MPAWAVNGRERFLQKHHRHAVSDGEAQPASPTPQHAFLPLDALVARRAGQQGYKGLADL